MTIPRMAYGPQRQGPDGGFDEETIISPDVWHPGIQPAYDIRLCDIRLCQTFGRGYQIGKVGVSEDANGGKGVGVTLGEG